MFAHNNSEIDYFRMAIVNALLVKKHLGVSVCVVTDKHSYQHNLETIPQDLINKAIDDLIVVEKDREFKNKNIKVYRDTVNHQKDLSFYNLNRADAYDISPYDETILLDTDYVILGDTLNRCWGSKNSIMMNYTWQDINFERKFQLDRVAKDSISMYWATVVYFTKSDYAESFFTMCKHVRQNASYYKMLYRWPGRTFRNDYVFSIAAHLVNNLQQNNIPELPFTLYKTFDLDDVHQVRSDSEIDMFLEKRDQSGEYILCNWKDLDLHVMNKWALNRISEDLMWYVK